MEKQKVYESVLAVLLLLLLLYYFFWTTKWMIAGILIFLVFALLFPIFARYIALAWEYLTKGIGFVMNRILMSAVFFLILSPIALMYRLTRNNKLKNTQESRLVDRNHLYTPKDIDKPW